MQAIFVQEGWNETHAALVYDWFDKMQTLYVSDLLVGEASKDFTPTDWPMDNSIKIALEAAMLIATDIQSLLKDWLIFTISDAFTYHPFHFIVMGCCKDLWNRKNG